MVSDASPGTTAPKMNKYFVHMAHMFFDCACAQDCYLKCPHPTIIDGDMRWDSGWFLAGFWGWGISNMQLARWKPGEKTPQSWRPPLPYGRHDALSLAPPHTTISQHAVQKVYVIKTTEYCRFYYL
jgi:hypothetical protein